MLTSIITWTLFGLVVGVVARLIYPGPQSLGLIKTALLGVAGSFVGGFLAFLITGGNAVQSSGWIASIVGAILVLAIAARRQRTFFKL